MTKFVDDGGPLHLLAFGRPPDGETMSLITEKLSGHVSSSRWLPGDMGWSELDEVREEHLRVRARVAADLEKLASVRAKYTAEDQKLKTDLEQAVRTGGPTPKDERTPEERRVADRSGIETSLWAGVKVLAEVADKVRATLAKNEAGWLADLRHGSVEAEEAVREHERLLAEAKVKAWRGVKLAQWLKSEVNGGAFGHQPVPTGREPMPPSFDPARHTGAFERRYYEQDQVLPLTQRPVPIVEPLGDEPDSLESDDFDAGSDLIEPLGPTPEDATSQPPGRYRMREVASRGRRA